MALCRIGTSYAFSSSELGATTSQLVQGLTNRYCSAAVNTRNLAVSIRRRSTMRSLVSDLEPSASYYVPGCPRSANSGRSDLCSIAATGRPGARRRHRTKSASTLAMAVCLSSTASRLGGPHPRGIGAGARQDARPTASSAAGGVGCAATRGGHHAASERFALAVACCRYHAGCPAGRCPERSCDALGRVSTCTAGVGASGCRQCFGTVTRHRAVGAGRDSVCTPPMGRARYYRSLRRCA